MCLVRDVLAVGGEGSGGGAEVHFAGFCGVGDDELVGGSYWLGGNFFCEEEDFVLVVFQVEGGV